MSSVTSNSLKRVEQGHILSPSITALACRLALHKEECMLSLPKDIAASALPLCSERHPAHLRHNAFRNSCRSSMQAMHYSHLLALSFHCIGERGSENGIHFTSDSSLLSVKL